MNIPRRYDERDRPVLICVALPADDEVVGSVHVRQKTRHAPPPRERDGAWT